MARIDSLSILLDGGSKDALAEKYGTVINNLQQNTISGIFKNKDLSGDPTTGTVEAKRFTNLESQSYGTARSGNKGQQGKAKAVTVAIDTDKELIEEVEAKDVRLYGVDNYINRKTALHGKSMERELERKFFEVAKTEGTDATLTKSTPLEKFEELVQKVTTLKNDYIDGVPRDMVVVICDESAYGDLRTYMDTSVQNANVNSAVKEIGTIHGVQVASSVYLPSNVTHIAMVDGAIAQPVMLDVDEGGKIPLSNAYHFGIYFSYGTKAVMPDTIFYESSEG